MTPKQVIIVRKDLNMRKGKMIAQGAHASMKVFFDLIREQPRDLSAMFDQLGAQLLPLEITIPLRGHMPRWVFGTFTKVVVGAPDEATLVQCYEAAKAAGLPCALVEDIGATEFHGVPTKTAVAIGPDDPACIDPITGGLSLL